MGNNIFGGEEKGHEEFKDKVDTHSKALVTVTQRQKDLESSVDLLGDKLELLDHNSVKNFKKIFAEMKHIKDEMRDLRSEVNSLKEFNSKIGKQMRLLSPRDDVSKLEKYIDLWNPMDFVTREELQDYKENFKEEIAKILEEFLKD